MKSLTFKKKLFGGEIEFVIYNSDMANTTKITEEAYKEALRLQKIFNFFDENSELSVLNKKRKMKVSAELLHVLKKALNASKLTCGRYDLTIGNEILKRKQGFATSKSKCSYKDLEITSDTVYLKNKNALIDLGSMAKGYITDKIGKFMQNKGLKEFMIDSRGDILFVGKLIHVLGIQHPRKKNSSICSIKVNNLGVATSGDYNQFYGNYEVSHILNRDEDVISTTVVAKSLEDADLFASVLFVSNKTKRSKIMRKNKKIKALVIKRNLSSEFYNNFEKSIS